MNGGETKLIYTAGPLYINGERTMREILKGRPIKESHIIAGVLVIIVVLVSGLFLYAYQPEKNRASCPCSPLGLQQRESTGNNVTLFVFASPSEAALVEGTTISYLHNQTEERIISASLYNKSGKLLARYNGHSWSYYGSSTADTLRWEVWMTLRIQVESVNTGDTIIIRPPEDKPCEFGTSMITLK